MAVERRVNRSGTEGRDARSVDIDELPALSLVQLLLDRQAEAVSETRGLALESLTDAVEATVPRLRKGGRLLYVGAGTSGRLLAADASELPPTFGWPKDRVVVLRPGVDGVGADEDAAELGARSISALGPTAQDVVVAVAASGRTPFVLSAVRAALDGSAYVVVIVANEQTELENLAHAPVVVPTGPEPIMGSTRMRAGTVQKLLLTAYSTAVMVRLGRTYGNLMVEMPVRLTKLASRAVRMVSEATGLDGIAAEKILEVCDGEIKTAIVSAWLGAPASQARQVLAHHNGRLRSIQRSWAVSATAQERD